MDEIILSVIKIGGGERLDDTVAFKAVPHGIFRRTTNDETSGKSQEKAKSMKSLSHGVYFKIQAPLRSLNGMFARKSKEMSVRGYFC